MENINYLICRLCGFKGRQLIGHIKTKHNISCKEYKEMFLGEKVHPGLTKRHRKIISKRQFGSGNSMYNSKRFGKLNPMYGKKQSQKSIEQGRKKIIELGLLKGENNPRWKGGICLEKYPRYWKYIRELILMRDHYTCTLCGNTHKETKFHVHHIIPINEFSKNEKAHNFLNLVTLCKSCHHRIEVIFDNIKKKNLHHYLMNYNFIFNKDREFLQLENYEYRTLLKALYFAEKNLLTEKDKQNRNYKNVFWKDFNYNDDQVNIFEGKTMRLQKRKDDICILKNIGMKISAK